MLAGRFRRRKVLVALSVTAITAAGVVTGVAYADSEPVDNSAQGGSLKLEDLNPAEREDVMEMAKQEGWSEQEAVNRIGWQQSFSKIAEKLETTYPDAFAGAEVTGNGTGAKIAFAGAVPAEAKKRVGSLPVKVQLIGGKGFSEAELNRILGQNMGVTGRKDVRSAVGSYDTDTGEISIKVEPEGRLSSASERAAMRDKLRPSQPKNKKIKVNLDVSDKSVGRTEAYMRGGGRLRTTSGAAHCTAAFTVRNSSGVRGISTAQHCAIGRRYLRYSNHGTSSYTTIGRKGTRSGDYGDVSWFGRGSYLPIARFYYTGGSTRPVSGSTIQYRGQTVCNYGLTTGRKCLTVHKRGVSYSYGGYSYRNLTAASRHVTAGGDSGGPWYYGHSAVGVHSGRVYVDGASRSVYSEVRHLRNGLGLRLLTT